MCCWKLQERFLKASVEMGIGGEGEKQKYSVAEGSDLFFLDRGAVSWSCWLK